jgi:hypothetical protein
VSAPIQNVMQLYRALRTIIPNLPDGSMVHCVATETKRFNIVPIEDEA